MNNDIQVFRFTYDELVTLRIYVTTKRQQRDLIDKKLTRDEALRLIEQLKAAVEGLPLLVPEEN
jgi:hypothetical protein